MAIEVFSILALALVRVFFTLIFTFLAGVSSPGHPVKSKI
jgi:hypothetical protein